MAHRSFADEVLPDPRNTYSGLTTALQDSLKVRPLKTIIIKVDHFHLLLYPVFLRPINLTR
jgi:hypothetical protein